MSPELELMQTFGFSQHDLKANEQGKLSASQRNRYWKEGLQVW